MIEIKLTDILQHFKQNQMHRWSFRIAVILIIIAIALLVAHWVMREVVSKVLSITAIMFCIMISFTMLYALMINSHHRLVFDQGQNYANNGDYISAYECWHEIPEFIDVSEALKEYEEPYNYQMGIIYEKNGEYGEAFRHFAISYQYEDSIDHILNCIEKLNERNDAK